MVACCSQRIDRKFVCVLPAGMNHHIHNNMDNNETTNGHHFSSSPLKLTPMEMEQEMASLWDETGDFSSVVSKLTLRKKKKPQSSNASVFTAAGIKHMLQRQTRTAFAIRNILVLALLGWLVFLFVDKMNNAVEDLEQTGFKDTDPRGIHQNSFGGDHNTGQPGGAKAREKHDNNDYWDLIIGASSNTGQHVPSMSMENALNDQGHYWHDPFQSPFASHLYDLDDSVLDEKQTEFEQKMQNVKETFGAWDLIDPYYADNGNYRPRLDATLFPNGDAPLAEFPNDVWQLDEEYVGNFISQARELIDRLKEGIYAEYGMPSTTPDGKHKLSTDVLKKRDEYFQVILKDFGVNNDRQAIDLKTKEPLKGVAYLNMNAWDGLVSKLLHTLMMNDDFYVVMTGDGAAAGHGNNFLQSAVMSFHYFMEPVFHILGMRLVTRNMAMKDVSTTFSALGGADIYGEADILWYSAEEPESEGQLDLLYKQAILSGARVPVLLTQYPGNIMKDSKGLAWTGSLQPGHQMCIEDKGSLSPACKLVDCTGDNTESPLCQRRAYESVCWVNRKDVTPKIPQAESVEPTAGYPGKNVHQLEGRKLSLLLLHALGAALDKWIGGIEADGFPLREKHWHIGTVYDTVREDVRTNIAADTEDRSAACEDLFSSFPMVCHVAMHAYTDWTPRVTPRQVGLKTILHEEMNATAIYPYIEEVYDGIDVLPQQWSIPNDQVDVHAIAIQSGLLGDGLSGWLKLFISGVKEGIILARFDLEVKPRINERTEQWTTIDGKDVDASKDDGGQRRLTTPSDFEVDLVINNGKTLHMTRSYFSNLGVKITDGLTVWPLLLDKSMAEKERDESDLGETIEIAIRIRSEKKPRDATMVLSHIYYA